MRRMGNGEYRNEKTERRVDEGGITIGEGNENQEMRAQEEREK